jgi:uncharacterized protein
MVATRRAITGLAVAVAIVAAAAVLALVAFGTDRFDYQDPFDPLPSPEAPGTGTEVDGAPDAQRDLNGYLAFVFNDIQGFWEGTLERSGLGYEPATLVLFRRAARSGCGLASSEVGPFYCPLDRRVYVDTAFFRQLAVEFHAPGDFAQAYVIAHEMGHHVQNLTGVFAQVDRAVREGRGDRGELSIATELQADCFAGVWGHSTYERQMLERGDLEEAIRAAEAVGDDRIQAKTTGRIAPESWTHGSSKQRRFWYLRGYEAGDPDACNTFAAGV